MLKASLVCVCAPVQKCFLEAAQIVSAGAGKGTCKLSGSALPKGEARFVAMTGESKVNLSLAAAATFLAPVLQLEPSFSPAQLNGQRAAPASSFQPSGPVPRRRHTALPPTISLDLLNRHVCGVWTQPLHCSPGVCPRRGQVSSRRETHPPTFAYCYVSPPARSHRSAHNRRVRREHGEETRAQRSAVAAGGFS